jgi:serine/threonine protein kinase
MWAFGVILYILIGGYLPFHHSDQQVMYNKIKKGEFTFHPKYWNNISSAAKELIRGLLIVDPVKRLTVDQALQHSWLTMGDANLENKKLDNSLDNLKKFQAGKKLKGAVKAVIAINRMKNLVKFSTSTSASSSAKLGGSSSDSLSSLPPPPSSPTTAVESAPVTPSASSSVTFAVPASDPATPPALSTKLPHTMKANYALSELLGEGQYAKVYNALSNITKEEVAIKVFDKKKMKKNDFLNLTIEIEIMNSFNHNNIVKYYDFFDEVHHCYVVMEKIGGGELFDRIVKKSHYTEKEAKELAKILIDAIKHMHDRNIIHR